MTNKYMYFIANWKMFGSIKSLNSLDKVIRFYKYFNKKRLVKIIYCPPNILINLMSKKFKNSGLSVGAQNCHENLGYGSFTGSVNCKMLKNVGTKFVIIGHSENRQVGETNKQINLKIKTALKSGLKVILCIGETLNEKRKKRTKNVLIKQITSCLKSIKNKKKILIAYEPVWSIGTGIIPKPNDLYSAIEFIKKKISKSKVLYGGSVNPKNIKELRKIKNIDGFLIGGASQNEKKFIEIIKKTYN